MLVTKYSGSGVGILVLQICYLICLFLRCLVFTSKFNSYSDFVFFGLQVPCISIWFFVLTKKTMQLFWFWYSVRFPVFNKEILERRTNFASVLVLFLMFSVLINIFFAGLGNFFFAVLLILLAHNALFLNGLLCKLPPPGFKALLGLNSDKPDDLETATQDRWNGNKWN